MLQFHERVRTISMRITTRQNWGNADQAAESSEPGAALGAIVRKKRFYRYKRPEASAAVRGLLEISV